MLDQSQDPTCHEAGGADRSAATCHLGHCDDATTGLDLDPAAVPAGDDLVGADLSARIYDDFQQGATPSPSSLPGSSIPNDSPPGPDTPQIRNEVWINQPAKEPELSTAKPT
jgi:hypothetical protein